MKRFIAVNRRARLLALTAVVALAVGCASLPPAQPALDLKVIAGQWRGTAQGQDGSRRDITMTITEDGRFESVIAPPTPLGSTFPGTVKVENGRYRYRSERTGNTGTITLHEGEGRRVLISRADNNSSYAELVPVKP